MIATETSTCIISIKVFTEIFAADTFTCIYGEETSNCIYSTEIVTCISATKRSTTIRHLHNCYRKCQLHNLAETATCRTDYRNFPSQKCCQSETLLVVIKKFSEWVRTNFKAKKILSPGDFLSFFQTLIFSVNSWAKEK